MTPVIWVCGHGLKWDIKNTKIMLRAKLNTDGATIYEVVDSEKKLKSLKADYEARLTQNSVDDAIMEIINAKPESERSIVDISKIAVRQKIDDAYEEAKQSFEKEYLEYQDDGVDDLEVGEYDSLRPYVEKDDNNVVHQKYSVVKNSFHKINAKITKLKTELFSTDYIIIKAYEAKLTLSDSPYTDEYIAQITTERQALRDKINELEELLKS